MTTWVKLGGKERPLSFGYEVGYHYETQTGGNYNEIVFEILADWERMANALHAGDTMGVAKALRIKPFADLVFFALAHEHRNRGIDIDFDAGTVAGWMFGNQAAMQTCVTALMDSLPRPDGDDAKKKPTASKSPARSPESIGRD